MQELSYTLIGDGSSDKALMNIINWLINDLYPELPTKPQFADFRNLPNPPKKGDVANQVKFASNYFPFDILFYHRDAETNSSTIIKERKNEIFRILSESDFANKTVCVVPVVMMESWLLFDEKAIKKAAENKNYSAAMNLPALKKAEDLKEPKKFLHELLRTVSNKKKRSLKGFNESYAVHLVAENIREFSPLRQLGSFIVFEEDTKQCIDNLIKIHSD